MAALDRCNRRLGRGTVVTASAGMPVRRTWATKFEMRSPRYTTRLTELPVVGGALASPPQASAGFVVRPGRAGAKAAPIPRVELSATPSMPDLEICAIVEEDDGTYAVTFAGTGTVVQLNGVPQLGLDIDRADDVAFHLETVDRLTATRSPARLDS